MGILSKGKRGPHELVPPLERDALRDDGIRSTRTVPDGVTRSVLASARHELRSPLQTIQGFAELLGSDAFGALTERQASFVEHIVQGSQEMAAVLDACVELAELALGSRTLERAHHGLRSALELASASFGHDVQTHWAPSCSSAHVAVEPAALARALSTLLHGLTLQSASAAAPTTFRFDVAVEGVHARLTLHESRRAGGATLLTVDEYALRRHATRSLLWLRLAMELLALQDGVLTVSEQLDCAEVRLPLSSPH